MDVSKIKLQQYNYSIACVIYFVAVIDISAVHHWSEWEDITDSSRDPNWMSVDPYEEILFAVQTIKVDHNQGIRFHLRSSPDDASGTYVNINIPANSGKNTALFKAGCWIKLSFSRSLLVLRFLNVFIQLLACQLIRKTELLLVK